MIDRVDAALRRMQLREEALALAEQDALGLAHAPLRARGLRARRRLGVTRTVAQATLEVFGKIAHTISSFRNLWYELLRIM